MSTLTEEHFNFIQSVAKLHGFNNAEIQTSGGLGNGEGYMGLVRFITVKEKEGEKQLELVLKSCHTSPELRKQLAIKEAYLKEAFMYETVFPSFISFQQATNVTNPFTSVPKIYGTLTKENHEALLLQNLRSAGYKLWNRKVPMDSKHVEIVLREYGKYHAVSFALKTIQPDKYAKMTENLLLKDVFGNEDMVRNMVKFFFKNAYEILGDHSAKRDLKKLENIAVGLYQQKFDDDKDELVVLHGDCWCNNMMFKYEEKENPDTPTKICFLDFQLSKPGSPVYDLAYFMYLCTPKSILVDLDKYLEIYHETLSKNLQEFGCDVDRIFSIEHLKIHWKKYSKYGLLWALGLIPAMMSESEDIADISMSADSGKNVFDSFAINNYKESVKHTFKERLIDLITFMSERQYL